ncbi:hypothetical protein QZH41_016738, partial [Actinostola sp. cb2023]
DAVKALNSLQTNAQDLAQIRKTRGRLVHDNLDQMRTFTQRVGVTAEMLEQLSVIHISGTKGKGSTCAFSESILRHSGYKTGFFSSPHLIEVRERIRLNGKPLTKELFTKYFFDCWDSLQATMGEHSRMPAYFRFMTMMSFYVFLQEKVDVAVIEVGIGGAYDSTNIIRYNMLENSKLGQPGVPAFTVEQEESALTVVIKRARELKIPLHLIPKLENYPGDLLGLKNTVWRGRSQTIVRPEITFYIDGAHTPRSMEACVKWFKTKADKEVKETNGTVARILLFNLTGSRDPHGLLRPLMNLKFDHAVFAPNAVNLERKDTSGNVLQLPGTR